MVLARRNTTLVQASQAVAYATEEDALAIVALLCPHLMTLSAGRLAPSELTSLCPRRDSGSLVSVATQPSLTGC